MAERPRVEPPASEWQERVMPGHSDISREYLPHAAANEAHAASESVFAIKSTSGWQFNGMTFGDKHRY
jgi:hypothetical protein